MNGGIVPPYDGQVVGLSTEQSTAPALEGCALFGNSIDVAEFGQPTDDVVTLGVPQKINLGFRVGLLERTDSDAGEQRVAETGYVDHQNAFR